jgi:xanthosine utilization system XapX-like protein
MVAGAAGTVALDTITYLDMAIRGRPASTTPATTVARLETVAGGQPATHNYDGDEHDRDTAAHRRSGLGALLGIATGLVTGHVYGMLRRRSRGVPIPVAAVLAGIGLNAGTVAPMAALHVTDPRTWPASSWLADIVPHLTYGVVTAVLFDAVDPSPRPARRR